MDPTSFYYNDSLNVFTVADAAVTGILSGTLAYYLVPGAANSQMAMQIAGVSFAGHLIGGYIYKKFVASEIAHRKLTPLKKV